MRSPDDARKHKRAGKCDGEEKERWEREHDEKRKEGRGDGADRYLFSLTKYFSLRTLRRISLENTSRIIPMQNPTRANGSVYMTEI